MDEPLDPVAELSGFTARTYGTAFVDVYDEWYGDVSPIDESVGLLASLAGAEPVLELGVGTGRLALPLAAAIAPNRVWGVDTSPEMLDALSAKDPHGSVIAIEADMTNGLPTGPFSLVFVAYNTLFNLTAEASQRACFAAVADRLYPGGRFVVEAFVPNDRDHREREQTVSVRTMTATEVVLATTRTDPTTQHAVGQFICLRDGEPVRLRPWAIRYSTIAELDRFAIEAGLELEDRWADVDRSPFTTESHRHVSVYRRPDRTPG